MTFFWSREIACVPAENIYKHTQCSNVHMLNVSTQPTPLIDSWAPFNHSGLFANNTPKTPPPATADDDAMPTAVWVLILVLIMLFLTVAHANTVFVHVARKRSQRLEMYSRDISARNNFADDEFESEVEQTPRTTLGKNKL